MTRAVDILKQSFLSFLEEHRFAGHEIALIENSDVFDYLPHEWVTRTVTLLGMEEKRLIVIENGEWIDANSLNDRWLILLNTYTNHYSPEPMPIKGEDTVLSEVINDLKKRQKIGINKYGTELKTNNGRDALKDAYQEILDAAMYLKQAMMERDI